MNMNSRVKGSISIMLTLILLPMMTYATMIVDASRLQVARTNISGAGDLVLNSIMSDYNTKLEEMYGLFANTTSEEDLKDVLQAYFKQTIESAFVPEMQKIDGQYVENAINGVLQSETFDPDEITNFLAMQLQSFAATPVTGSALANPNTLKRQIIEYMKYRGPVSLGSTILGKLDYLKDANQQLDAVDNKVQYAEKLGQMQGPCQDAYEAIESMYNVGAMPINELIDQGIAEDDTQASAKKNLDALLADSCQQYQYAAAFYLLDTQSPFNNTDTKRTNYIDYKILGKKQLESLKGTEDPSTLYKDANGNNIFTPNLKSPEIREGMTDEQIRAAEKAAYEANVSEYLSKLKDIVDTAKNDCGYDNFSVDEGFDKITASPSASTQRYVDGDGHNGVLNRYSFYGYAPQTTVSTTKDGKKCLNYSKIENDDTTLMQTFKDLPAESESFDKQIQKSLAIFEVQRDVETAYSDQIADYSCENMILGELNRRYLELWDDFQDCVRTEFDAEMAELRAYQQEVKRHNSDVKIRYEDAIIGWRNQYIEALISQQKALGDEKQDWDGKHTWEDGYQQNYYWLMTDDDSDWTFTADEWEELNDRYDDRLIFHTDDVMNGWYDEQIRKKIEEPVEPGRDDSRKDPDLYWPEVEINYSAEWNKLCSEINGIDTADQNRAALNQIINQMGWYGGRVNAFLDLAENHNTDYYIKYANIYINKGGSGIANAAMQLQLMKQGLVKTENYLNNIHDLITKDARRVDGTVDLSLEHRQENWKESIEKETAESTKAVMLSDHESLVGRINKEDVEALQKLVGDLKTQVDKMFTDITNIKFLDKNIIITKKTSEVLTRQTMEELNEMQKGKRDFFNVSKSPIVESLYDKAWTRIAEATNGNEYVLEYRKYEDDPAFARKDAANAETEADMITFSTKTSDANSVVNVAKSLATIDQGGKSSVFKYNTSSLYQQKGDKWVLKDEISHFRVLDGLDDSKQVAYTKEAQSTADIETKANTDPSILAKDEAFVITLFSEAKAAEQAEKEKKAEEEGKEKPSQDIENAAQEQINDIDKEDDNTSEEKADLESEPFKPIMDGIIKYSEQCNKNEQAQECQAPSIQSAEIKTGKDAGKSSSGNALGEAKKFLSNIATIGEKIAENVYLEEYFTEMFTCRTDNPKLMTKQSTSDVKDRKVIMLNGYCNSAADPNSSCLLNENTEWYGKEIEYLLFGQDDLQKNMLYTDGTIFAIRFALNAIYAFTAADIQTYALQLATAIAGWTIVGIPIVQACITILIALAESGYDLYLLHAGKNVPIYKSITTFVCSPTNALKTLVEDVGKNVIDTVMTEAKETIEDKLNSTIDDLEKSSTDWANKKVSQIAGSINGVVNDFGTEQIAAIENMLEEQFINPILNKVTALQSLTQIAEQYASCSVEDLAGQAVDDAFKEITNSINTNFGEFTDQVTFDPKDGSLVQQLCVQFLHDNVTEPALAAVQGTVQSASDTLKEQFKTALVDYLTDLEITDAASEIQEHVYATSEAAQTALENLKTTLSQKLSAKLDKYRGKITDAVTDITKNIQDDITKATDKAASTAKSFVKEKLDAASVTISGKAKSALDGITKTMPDGKGKIDTDTATTTSVCLNYKEYCKILTLLFVTFNQEAMLQRSAVLITANMRHATSNADANFEITNANTLFSVNAQVNMRTLFPWPARDELNDTDPNSGLKFDLNNIHGKTMTINYCGVNGY